MLDRSCARPLIECRLALRDGLFGLPKGTSGLEDAHGIKKARLLLQVPYPRGVEKRLVR